MRLAEDGVMTYHRLTRRMKTNSFPLFISLMLASTVALAQTTMTPEEMRTHAALHLLAGMAAGLLSAGVADSAVPGRTISDYPLLLPAIAVSSATTAGIAKETLDSTGFGVPLFAEAMFTTGGGVLAGAMIGCLEGARISPRVPLVAVGTILAIPVMIAFVQEVEWNAHQARKRRGP